MSVNLISRIFSDYHKGKDGTNGRKYRYTLEYNPLSAVHTWIVRRLMGMGATASLKSVLHAARCCTVKRGDCEMIFSCVLFFFWFFSALFKASK